MIPSFLFLSPPPKLKPVKNDLREATEVLWALWPMGAADVGEVV